MMDHAHRKALQGRDNGPFVVALSYRPRVRRAFDSGFAPIGDITFRPALTERRDSMISPTQPLAWATLALPLRGAVHLLANLALSRQCRRRVSDELISSLRDNARRSVAHAGPRGGRRNTGDALGRFRRGSKGA